MSTDQNSDESIFSTKKIFCPHSNEELKLLLWNLFPQYAFIIMYNFTLKIDRWSSIAMLLLMLSEKDAVLFTFPIPNVSCS